MKKIESVKIEDLKVLVEGVLKESKKVLELNDLAQLNDMSKYLTLAVTDYKENFKGKIKSINQLNDKILNKIDSLTDSQLSDILEDKKETEQTPTNTETKKQAENKPAENKVASTKKSLKKSTTKKQAENKPENKKSSAKNEAVITKDDKKEAEKKDDKKAVRHEAIKAISKQYKIGDTFRGKIYDDVYSFKVCDIDIETDTIIIVTTDFTMCYMCSLSEVNAGIAIVPHLKQTSTDVMLITE